MTSTDLLALLPWIVLAVSAVANLLLIAFRRDPNGVFILTLAGLLLSLALVPLAGTWAPRQVTPLLVVDRYALVFVVLAGAAGLVIAGLCRDYAPSRVERPEELYLLITTAVFGADILAASRHFATLFLGLETLSVSLFALIAYPYRDGRALEAGTKYLVLSGLASGLLLFGMALVYADDGVLAFADLGVAQGGLIGIVGLLLMMAGLGFKLSLAPFHLWTADVYQGAPTPVTALLATVAKGAVWMVLLRLVISGGWGRVPVLEDVAGLLAILSMLVGNLLALRQDNLKRLLAYSAIAHMGYLLIVLVAGATLGGSFAAEALLFYLIAYFVTTLAAFGVIAVLSHTAGEAERLEDYAGLFHTRPWPAAVLGTALLSLAGIPLTAGFVGKFYLIAAAGQGGLWWLLAALVVGSGLGLYYYVRVILHMARLPTLPSTLPARLPVAGHLVLAALFALVLGLGIYPAGVIDWLLPAAGGLR